MNILNLDFKDSIPNIIDAYVEIYGEKYRSIITNRANKIVYIYYNNLFGIKGYYKNLLMKDNKKIHEYEEYINNEENRKKKINNSKKYQIYLDTKGELETLKNKIKSKFKLSNDLEIINALLSSKYGIEFEFNIESFGEEYDKILNDKNSSEIEKNSIIEERKAYYESIRVTTAEEKKIMTPSYELVNLISKNRKTQLKKAKKEFICSERSISKLLNVMDIDSMYDYIKDNIICSTGGSNELGNYFPVIFYTIIEESAGKLDYMFLHEFCHAIESVEKEDGIITGFDQCNLNNIQYNSYNPDKRKYEVMNETFTDIFALEAREILHNKNIYFAESKELCDNDLEDINSSVILKRVLKPFLLNYRDEIIETRLNGNLEEFISYIEVENYESLNDSINKIDYLIEEGLCNEINNNQSGKLRNSYNEEINKIKKIYDKLGITKDNNKQK